MNNLNIALICTEKLPIPPVDGGAIQLYIEGILPYLSPLHDITVFSIQTPKLPNEEIKDGVKYVRLPAGSKTEYLNSIKLHLNENFDWVHVFNRPLWVNHLAENLPKTKFSLSLHNEMFHKEKISPQQAYACIEKVEFINTVSKFIADGVAKLYPKAEKKLRVVYSGVDLIKLKPAWSEEGIANKEKLKSKYKLNDNKVVLFVGRLSEKKGAHILLNAMKEIMDTHKDIALVVIGSKWYGANKEDEYTRKLQFITKKLKGPVIFTGFLPPEEVFTHYNLGDIFVCASQWNEPLARVHYEAMAAGLPIITTNRGGNAEVVAGLGNGIVIDDFSNHKVFAEKIRFLLKNSDIALQYGKTGRKLAEDSFNWERVAKEALAPLLELDSTGATQEKGEIGEANIGPSAQANNEIYEEYVDKTKENNTQGVDKKNIEDENATESHLEENFFDVVF